MARRDDRAGARALTQRPDSIRCQTKKSESEVAVRQPQLRSSTLPRATQASVGSSALSYARHGVSPTTPVAPVVRAGRFARRRRLTRCIDRRPSDGVRMGGTVGKRRAGPWRLGAGPLPRIPLFVEEHYEAAKPSRLAHERVRGRGYPDVVAGRRSGSLRTLPVLLVTVMSNQPRNMGRLVGGHGSDSG
jgi:hypothetical protein